MLKWKTYFDLLSTQQRRLWVFEHVYLKPFDKYFKAAWCLLTSSCFQNKHKLWQNGSSNSGNDSAYLVYLFIVMRSRLTRHKPIITQIKPIRMNMIVIRTRVDITISVCQMINYRRSTNSLINLETGLDVLSYSAHMDPLFLGSEHILIFNGR